MKSDFSRQSHELEYSPVFGQGKRWKSSREIFRALLRWPAGSLHPGSRLNGHTGNIVLLIDTSRSVESKSWFSSCLASVFHTFLHFEAQCLMLHNASFFPSTYLCLPENFLFLLLNLWEADFDVRRTFDTENSSWILIHFAKRGHDENNDSH